jgi:hypothetical protein
MTLTDKSSQTCSPKVTLQGKVIRGLEPGPHGDDPEYCQSFIICECDGRLYTLNRIIEREYQQELEQEYQAIMAAGIVQAEGLICSLFWDTEEWLGRPNPVPVGVGVLVDCWAPLEAGTSGGAPGEASGGKKVTLILQPCDGKDFSALPDCIEVKSDLAIGVEAIIRGGMENGLAWQCAAGRPGFPPPDRLWR